MFMWYQMVSPENTSIHYIIQTEQVKFRNIRVYVYTHVHVTTINGEREQEGVY